ncbi:Armadillo-type fold [Sesbania bispinosa]|nr:Armadillo-type fold [Sesbania bispinosa]
MDSSMRHSQFKDTGNGQKSSVATLFEQVGLQKILSLLESDDANVRIHAVKVVANLAAEGRSLTLLKDMLFDALISTPYRNHLMF